MKPHKPLSYAEVRRAGFEALVEKLGVANALRFVIQTEPGRGSYANERDALFEGLTLDQLARELESQAKPPIRGRQRKAPRRR